MHTQTHCFNHNYKYINTDIFTRSNTHTDIHSHINAHHIEIHTNTKSHSQTNRLLCKIYLQIRLETHI